MTGRDLALSARGVRMEYRDRSTDKSLLAIEGVDLDLAEGEFVSLLGPSGCGKSTFLKIVNGLLEATSGEIKLRKAKKGREDAMVFQDAALFPWYSVLDNIAYGLVCSGMSRRDARRRALPLIDLVGLSGFAEKYPYQLSGGMQQRANLARALAVDSEILLMDEPFASLDEQTRLLLGDKVLQIQQDLKQTTLLITHNITEAVQLSDRVVVMSYRPGTLKRIVEIDLPRPRTSEIVSSARFGELVGLIWADLREEASRGMMEVERKRA